MISAGVLVASLAAAACQRRGEPPAGADGAQRTADASIASAEGAAADGGRLSLTAERLERYLGYQRAVLEGQRTLAPDGGALAVLERLARAEEEARVRFGLQAQEVDAIDELITDVFAERSYALSAGLDRLIAQGEAMTAKLPADQRGDFELELQAIRQQRDEARALPRQRERYGDANVDLVLTREAELMKLWNERVSGR